VDTEGCATEMEADGLVAPAPGVAPPEAANWLTP